MYRRTTDITRQATLQHSLGSNAACNDTQTHEKIQTYNHNKSSEEELDQV